MNFLVSVHIEDTIAAQVELVEIMAKEKQARFKTICVNQEGTNVLDGEVVVSPIGHKRLKGRARCKPIWQTW